MRSLTDWLFSEAGAGWVFGLVSLIAFIMTIFNRRGPNRLVINELHKARLVNVHEEVDDKVQIIYSGEPVKILGQIEIEMFNEGIAAIKEAEITCSLPEDTKILDMFLISSTGNLPTEKHTNGNKATIKLPYVNSYREHHHVIKLLINVDGEVETIRFEGAGEGWSVRHIPLLTERQQAKLVITSLLVLFGSVGISFILTKLVEKLWGITYTGINLSSILLTLPAITGGVFSIYLPIGRLYRKERFRLNKNFQQSSQ